jgi:MSHA biogenesis protein MshQ
VLAAILLAALATACSFKSPGTSGNNPNIDAADPDADAATDAPPGTWLTGWAHRKKITLHASKIDAPGNGALTDFPVLVSVVDTQITAGTLATGADIVFTAANGTTLLASENEAFTPATKELVAWVKVPTLSATVDTTLYVYYGNAAPPTRPATDTWTAGYFGVWHLSQDPRAQAAGNMLDATSAGRHSTSRNMDTANSVPGQIGRGVIFDGSTEFMDFPSLNVGNAFTISMWVNLANVSDIRTLISNSDSGLDTNGFRLFVNTLGSSNRKLLLETGNGGGGSGKTAETPNNAVPTSTFAHLAAVVDRTAQSTLLYVNGVRANTDTSTASNFQNSSDLNAGRAKNGIFHFAGTLDQIEIASVLRPIEWLKTAVNNQSQPQSFHTLDAEENAP